MEIWKDIPDWEGFYAASDQGRIMSLSRTHTVRGLYTRTVRQKILRGRRGVDGSRSVTLSRVENGSWYNPQINVSRLVLLAFRGIPAPGYVAGHKEEGCRDDRLANLEWRLPAPVIHDRESPEFLARAAGFTRTWRSRHKVEIKARRRQYVSDAATLAKHRARQNKKYAEDAAYRAAKLAKNALWFQANKSKQKEYSARSYAKKRMKTLDLAQAAE